MHKINCKKMYLDKYAILFILYLSLFTVITSKKISDGKISSKFEPNWASLDSRPLPQWYDEAKIGMCV